MTRLFGFDRLPSYGFDRRIDVGVDLIFVVAGRGDLRSNRGEEVIQLSHPHRALTSRLTLHDPYLPVLELRPQGRTRYEPARSSKRCRHCDSPTRIQLMHLARLVDCPVSNYS